ncbi:MAG: ATP-binding cassette domain-containing protein [Symbiobacteriaceae bacterium]|nr:ATP-binding cassette domain-containing protein [Symbiobacteriaceae bacterium]
MTLDVHDLSLTLNPDTIFTTQALRKVSFVLVRGEVTAVVGHTGSGKSTLLQVMAGLQVPTEGEVILDGMRLYERETDIPRLRRLTGLSFQYPEHQFFEETVEKELAFGLLRRGESPEEIIRHSSEMMALFGLDSSLMQRSPFELSGGQMRRLGLAITFALKPAYLLLDEPLAGLDPSGKRDVLAAISVYAKQYQAAVVLVSHNMDDIAEVADRLIVLSQGEVLLDGPPYAVFSEESKLATAGLEVPQVFRLIAELRRRGMPLQDGYINSNRQAYHLVRELLLKAKAPGSCDPT